jgi:hypothetical protein
MTTAKKRAPAQTKAKSLPPRAEREDIDLSDVPELTAEQLAGARRRGPERFARGFPVAPLEALRKGAGVTQVGLATAAEMTQAEVSRLEGRESLEGVRIETLRRYVEGLGAKLELVATFPSGHRMGLTGK